MNEKFKTYLREAKKPNGDNLPKEFDAIAWDIADDTGVTYKVASQLVATAMQIKDEAGEVRDLATKWAKDGGKVPADALKKAKSEPIKSCWGCGKDWHGTADGKREGNAYLTKHKGKLMCPPCIEEYEGSRG